MLLCHHHKEDVAFVPARDPANTPAIDVVTEGHGPVKAEELGEFPANVREID
jgi:hypothetical protein